MHHRTLFVTTIAFAALSFHAQAQSPYSTSLYGPLGLNVVPSARMDETGTMRAQISTLDPYAHAALGVQIADPLAVTLRQTAETSSLGGNADRLYPGMDFKLRLLKERAHTPQIAIGAQSAIGHKRSAGEYITASKRYKGFDFTGGIGWGRFASAKHFDNPLNAISSHFGKTRDPDGEDPNNTDDWFTGEHIGLFAGIEYFTPYNGLSIKADYGADRYAAEKTALNYTAPAPWSVGVNYKPFDWLDLGLAAQGVDKIMGRISLQNNIKNARHQSANHTYKAPLRPYRTDLALPNQMQSAAAKDNIALSYAAADLKTASANLKLTNRHSTPLQIGKAATHMANHAGPSIEALTITPLSEGLRGPNITLMRRDLEKALANNNGSAEEIWHNAEIKNSFSGLQKIRPVDHNDFDWKKTQITLENTTSLAEDDKGAFTRTALTTHLTGPHIGSYLLSGFGLRLNVHDNLRNLHDFRPRVPLPVRSDVDQFADRRIAVETLYTALPHTIAPDLHMVVAGGYLEEMYAGFGGEILYRPFNKRFAVGGESWLALKRDPDSLLNLNLTGDHLLTAHLNASYDLPKWDMTLGVKAGQYLAADTGASLSLTKYFKNGAKLEGYLTLSDQSDYDLFGSETHADHGLRLTVPLGGFTGGFKFAPDNMRAKITSKPLGRDIGQSIQSPLPLFELTDPLSQSHLIRHWTEVTDYSNSH